jgi:hypothetical protein
VSPGSHRHPDGGPGLGGVLGVLIALGLAAILLYALGVVVVAVVTITMVHMAATFTKTSVWPWYILFVVVAFTALTIREGL